MFTQEELNEIVAAYQDVFAAIQYNFTTCSPDGETNYVDDTRAAQTAAVQIVAAKIIAQGKRDD